ncbi:MAG: hypothetical protein ACM3X6_10145 [Patescibacteria group bacterium]
MPKALGKLIEMLPLTSMFRSQRPAFFLIFCFLLAIPGTFVVLQLAWHSIGLRIPIRKTLIPATMQGLLVMFLRQILPLPFQALADIVLTTYFTIKIGRTSLSVALIATFFSEIVLIMGSIILTEPVYALVKDINLFLSDPANGLLLFVLETAFPTLVLIVFRRFDLCIVKRS